MGRHLSPRYGQVILVSGYLVLTAVKLITTISFLRSWASKVVRKCEKNIGFPVVRTDGRRAVGVRSRDYQIFWDG